MAVLAVVLRTGITVAALDAVAVLALSALVLWTLASAAWSDDVGAALQSAERLLLYAAALAATVLALRRSSYGALVVGVWAGTTLVCGYASLTRMYPSRFASDAAIAGKRLAQPVGYWNSLGLLAAVGILAGVGLVAATRSRALGGVAAASLVPLSIALYFTFSRGAAIVLAAGALVAFVLDPRRLRLALAGVVTLTPAALVVLKASHLSALTTKGASAARAADAGATLVRFALLGAAVAVALGVLLVAAERRVRVPRGVRIGFVIALAVVALAAVGAASARYGSPPKLAQRAWHSFTAKPKQANGNLNSRLLTLSNNGRLTLWRVAWRDFRAHPLQGSGAGSYYGVWVHDRPDATQVRNAHSLYLETLAELGVPGLLLLTLALLAPLAAAVRARRDALVGVCGGAYVAFLLHAAFDWDWQLPGVTLAPLLLGAAALAAARADARTLVARNAFRIAAVAALAVVAALAGLALLGNRAVASAEDATRAGHWHAAEDHARRATSLQPWSAEPWRVLGEAQLQQGSRAAARKSFRAGLAKNPHDWLLWLDLALASPRSARPAAARRALVLNPRSTEIARIRPFLGL